METNLLRLRKLQKSTNEKVCVSIKLNIRELEEVKKYRENVTTQLKTRISVNVTLSRNYINVQKNLSTKNKIINNEIRKFFLRYR